MQNKLLLLEQSEKKFVILPYDYEARQPIIIEFDTNAQLFCPREFYDVYTKPQAAEIPCRTHCT